MFYDFRGPFFIEGDGGLTLWFWSVLYETVMIKYRHVLALIIKSCEVDRGKSGELSIDGGLEPA